MKFINLKTRAEEAFIPHPTVLCIGDFDGVHLGHRQLVAAVLKQYNALSSVYEGLVSGVWFFGTNYFKGADEIYSVDEKLSVFASLGLDYAVIADFDEMKSLLPDEFVSSVLIGSCKCVYSVCGKNFRFGRYASGDSDMLFEMMKGRATVVPLFSVGDALVSSTLIRSLLADGEIEKANQLLSDNYSVNEQIVHGKALGRKLGIPTINQNAERKKLILKNGIYATICYVDGVKYFGVTNIGTRPTVEDSEEKNIETHIIGFDGDCYGKTVKLEFIKRIRDEMRFQSLNALKEQIQKDILEVRDYFNL